MELENPNNGESEDVGGGGVDHVLQGRGSPPRHSMSCYADDFDSACSTPFVSAPSSPGRGAGVVPVAVSGGYFFSAPSSPMHYVLSSAFSPSSPSYTSSFEFEFSARFPPSATAADGSMSSADELFLNGQIRPMKLSSHLQHPQHLAPLMDLNGEEEDDNCNKCEAQKEGEKPVAEISGGRGRDLKLRSRSIRRQARSLSPLMNAPFFWRMGGGGGAERTSNRDNDPSCLKKTEAEVEIETETPPVSASSSRSSSTSSSSSSSTSSTKKRWISFKDLLPRGKSEGSGKSKEKFWHAIPFAALKDRPKPSPAASTTSTDPVIPPPSSDPEKKPTTASFRSTSTNSAPTARRRRRGAAPSPHEKLYTANRAQAEEMRRRTFLPYRQGLLGCLGFGSRGYFAINGLARSLHSVSSR